MQAFRSHHQHFGDELIKAVIDQHVGDFITNFGDGLIPCHTHPLTLRGGKLVSFNCRSVDRAACVCEGSSAYVCSGSPGGSVVCFRRRAVVVVCNSPS